MTQRQPGPFVAVDACPHGKHSNGQVNNILLSHLTGSIQMHIWRADSPKSLERYGIYSSACGALSGLRGVVRRAIHARIARRRAKFAVATDGRDRRSGGGRRERLTRRDWRAYVHCVWRRETRADERPERRGRRRSRLGAGCGTGSPPRRGRRENRTRARRVKSSGRAVILSGWPWPFRHGVRPSASWWPR
jgi:hypothetical protein